MPENIDAATWDALQRMHATTGLQPPDPAAYTVTTTPAPQPQRQSPGDTPQPWDTAAFDALPAETRTAVLAGMAHTTGRNALATEARRYCQHPDDVHALIADPERFVDEHGIADTHAIHQALAQLITAGRLTGTHHVAELDTRRHAPPHAGAGHQPPAASAVDATLTRMQHHVAP